MDFLLPYTTASRAKASWNESSHVFTWVIKSLGAQTNSRSQLPRLRSFAGHAVAPSTESDRLTLFTEHAAPYFRMLSFRTKKIALFLQNYFPFPDAGASKLSRNLKHSRRQHRWGLLTQPSPLPQFCRLLVTVSRRLLWPRVPDFGRSVGYSLARTQAMTNSDSWRPRVASTCHRLSSLYRGHDSMIIEMYPALSFLCALTWSHARSDDDESVDEAILHWKCRNQSWQVKTNFIHLLLQFVFQLLFFPHNFIANWQEYWPSRIHALVSAEIMVLTKWRVRRLINQQVTDESMYERVDWLIDHSLFCLHFFFFLMLFLLWPLLLFSH